MPAVNLVNIAPSVPDTGGKPTAADVFLHQTQGNVADGQPVHDGKPLPRDPTATLPKHDLGPRLTYVSTGAEGAVYDPAAGVMVNRALSAEDQARAIVHDWAMHSDCAVPAFVLPASDDPADHALAQAVLARFLAKQPTEQDAEAFGKAFQTVGRGDVAEAAYAYKQRAVALAPKLWVPGAEGDDIAPDDLLLLLAAQQAEDWDAMLAAITGPTALVVNAGVDQAGTFINSTYLGLSASTTDPVAGDTSLTGEILTSGGGLVPASVTYSHTNGTGTFTASCTHTANGSDSLPVTVAQMCLRTASGGGGTMRVREKYSSTATLSASGDAMTSTYTLTVASS